jgi:hypothetical protein
MIVTLSTVSKGNALPPTSLRFASGAVTMIEAETEQRPSVLGLIASGRMRPASGTVTLDGAPDTRALRRAVALVDAPDVNEPASGVSLAGIVAEELMFAGAPAGPHSVSRWLAATGVTSFSSYRISDVPPGIRVRLLLELALMRSGVQGVVLVSPDRHGGHPEEWWSTVQEIASRGIAVLVIVGYPAVVALAASSAPSPSPSPSPSRRGRPRIHSTLGRTRRAAS